MADLIKKQHGVHIDVNNPNVEVISLLDVDKCVDIIDKAIRNLGAKKKKSTTKPARAAAPKKMKKKSAKKAATAPKKAAKKVQSKKLKGKALIIKK